MPKYLIVDNGFFNFTQNRIPDLINLSGRKKRTRDLGVIATLVSFITSSKYKYYCWSLRSIGYFGRAKSYVEESI